MAPRNAAAAAARAELQAAEREERELNDDINEAIARTDSEVFTDAMGDEPIDEEMDTSLEDMGEGLEGDEIEDEPGEEGEELSPGEGSDEQQPPAERQPPPSIPPRVLRETRERFREQEDYLQQQMRDLQQQNRDLQMRLDNLARQPQQPPPVSAQEPVKPDRWADPEGYDAWLENRAEKRALETARAQMAEFRAEQRRTEETRLNEAFRTTAQGPRGYEFNVAFQDLTNMEKTPENANLVRTLCSASDPGAAVLDWWERTSNPDYVEWHRNQIRETYSVQQPPQRAFRQNGFPQRSRQVRHETRLPRSLSDASGATSQHVENPEMYDDSEASVFSYGASR